MNNLLLVVNHSAQLYNQRKAFQKAVGSAVTLTSDQTSSHNTIAEALEELKVNCHWPISIRAKFKSSMSL